MSPRVYDPAYDIPLKCDPPQSSAYKVRASSAEVNVHVTCLTRLERTFSTLVHTQIRRQLWIGIEVVTLCMASLEQEEYAMGHCLEHHPGSLLEQA